jgi:CRISPR-associated protein Cas5t
MAIAVIGIPEISIVLRTAWRIKDKKAPPGSGSNKRPDYQEVLSDLKLGIWVAPGPLAEKLQQTREAPGQIDRYGGLSLGESRDLVNEILFCPFWKETHGRWLVPDPEGEHPLPIWVDHVGSRMTNWSQFRIESRPLEEPTLDDSRWITIQPRKDRPSG